MDVSVAQTGGKAGQTKRPSKQALRGLDALNFFLADVRDGLGPYLAIYLIA
ncbi:MAG: MFS transporter, partial [Parafilimonas terrae]|nr:MFS transporter [Parafilimonas terrae]